MVISNEKERPLSIYYRAVLLMDEILICTFLRLFDQFYINIQVYIIANQQVPG